MLSMKVCPGAKSVVGTDSSSCGPPFSRQPKLAGRVVGRPFLQCGGRLEGEGSSCWVESSW